MLFQNNHSIAGSTRIRHTEISINTFHNNIISKTEIQMFLNQLSF